VSLGRTQGVLQTLLSSIKKGLDAAKGEGQIDVVCGNHQKKQSERHGRRGRATCSIKNKVQELSLELAREKSYSLQRAENNGRRIESKYRKERKRRITRNPHRVCGVVRKTLFSKTRKNARILGLLKTLAPMGQATTEKPQSAAQGGKKGKVERENIF